MKLKPYSEYKDSGLLWIGNIPKWWDSYKIKHVTNVKISNVDKKSKSGEPEVLLCNYTDVYNKEHITSKLDFMKATASFEQINKLSLKKGDVIITKDSEAADDIGVQALVKETLDNVVCGYHLALIRPNDKIRGDYLFRLLESKQINDQFVVAAKGVTRFGISTYPIKNSYLMIPPIEEQRRISSFLDKKTSKINQTIEKYTKLIELLKEKRTTLINHVVTKGLDPRVKMKDSGVEWIGKIPENWNFSKIKRYSQILTGGTPSRDIQSYWENGTINWMSSGEINYRRLNFTKEKITSDGLRNSNARILPKNSVMIALNGQGKTKGMVATLNISTSCNQSLAAFVCDESNIHFNFIYYFLRSKYKDIRGLVGSNEREGLSLAVIKDIFVPVPPFKTQIEIANYLDEKTSKINQTINKIQKNITLLEEYKKSLIHHIVTGEVDVREGTV